MKKRCFRHLNPWPLSGVFKIGKIDTFFYTRFFVDLGVCLQVLLGPIRKRVRQHQIELCAVSIGDLGGLQDRTKKAAVVGQKDRLDDIQIAFRLDVVIVTHTAKAQGLVVFMHDADHALTKALDGVFSLERDQAMAQGPCDEKSSITSTAAGQDCRDSNLQPFRLLYNADRQCRGCCLDRRCAGPHNPRGQ